LPHFLLFYFGVLQETEKLIQEEAERFGKLQSEISDLERKNDELAKRRLAIVQCTYHKLE